MTPPPEPALLDEYGRRVAELEVQDRDLTRQFNRLAALRGVVFVVALALLWFVLARETIPAGWVGLPGLAFLALMLRHETVVRARDRVRRRCGWYRHGLARLEDRWIGAGDAGEQYREPDHLFAADLDLFGIGSVFELVSTARTPAGRQILAEWLQRPAEPGAIAARQEAVRALRDDREFRIQLAVLGAEVGEGIDRDVLSRWGGAPPAPIPSWVAPAAFALAAANVAGLVAATWFGLTPWVPAATILAGMTVAQRVRVQVRRIVAGIARPSRDLDHMAGLVDLVARGASSAPLLGQVRGRLGGEAVPASRALARLHRVSALLDSRKNQLFAPLAALLLWTTQLALVVERWRARHGPRLGDWVDALGEVEALASLATYADEHPGDAWPEMVPGPARLEASGLVHPLLPRTRAVPNDLRLAGGEAAALVVSGSNMSGKSTLLRAAGVNVVLAQAGAPVSAIRLRLSPLAIGASFRPQDSLREGESRFYAEIGRLRRTVDLLGQGRPVLFLLDEMLSGTNSYDRAIGARAIVEHLVTRGAIGLVTTHDLALAEIADALAPRTANVHFEDALVEGQLRFDYRLRPGVVRRSNAVELMRAVGLPL